MTVAELIEMLKNVPQDSMVVIPGYEGGYDNPSITTEDIIVDQNWNGYGKNEWYNGRHGNVHDAEDGTQPINAVVIGRTDTN